MSWRSLARWLSVGWAGSKYRLSKRHAGLLRRQARPRFRRAFLEPLEDRSLLAAMITVNSTGDTVDSNDNVLTLREAILVSNGTLSIGSLSTTEAAQITGGTPTLGVADTIAFNVPGAGVQTISPTTALPAITDPVTIDGYTQPGASANTQATGSNAVLLIELSGGQVPGFSNAGLNITAGKSIVRGLIINRWGAGGDGIFLGTNGGNTIEGNWIGTDSTGKAAAPSFRGIEANNGSNNNVIGGITPQARNVLSGNQSVGVVFFGSHDNIVQGNYIGTDPSGKLNVGNSDSGVVSSAGSGGSKIGGTTAAERNIISGNSFAGISLGENNTVQGNYIGTDVTGMQAIPNGVGITIDQTFSPSNNLIGGTATGAGNLISGNTHDGINLGRGESNNTVQGNLIGTDMTGAKPLGNLGNGISIGGSGGVNDLIGGTVAGAANTIAFNGTPGQGGAGVFVDFLNTGHAILSNSIFQNVGLGIDLSPNGNPGLTPNDQDDPDTGGNNVQNFPEISSAVFNAGTIVVQYAVPSTTANSAYPLRIEFFKADQDAQEGQIFLGSDTYDAASAESTRSFTFTPPAGVNLSIGDTLVATATDSNSNTSEFSIKAGLQAFSVTNAVTYANTQSTSGLVITPNAGTVKFFQITNISSGALFQNDGVTPINNGDFITVADGGAGLKFTPNKDFVGTGQFTVQAATTNNSAGLGGSTVTVTISVIQPTISVTVSPAAVNEDSAGNLVYVFSRTDDPSLPLLINFNVSGTADSNSDYIIGPGSADVNITGTTGTLPFDAGSSTAVLNIHPLSDNLVEGDETIQYTIAPGTGYTTQTPPATATGTIQDADTASVAFQSSTTTALEDNGAIAISVVLSMASGNTLQDPAAFTISAVNGSASNTDYNSGSFPATVTFPAGSSGGAATLVFMPTADTLVEGDETVTLSLGVSSGAATIGAPATNVVTIQDADTASVAFQLATSTAGEDAGAHGVVAVLTTAAGNTLQNSASFSVTAVNGSASNADYDGAVFPKTITFAAGSGNDAQRTVNLIPTPDNLVEGNENVTLTLTATSGAANVGSQGIHDVAIQDADSANISIVAGQTVAEDGAAQPINVRLNMAPGLRLERPLGVEMSAAPAAGTELADANFGPLANVTFQPADLPGAVHATNFTPTPDTLVEGNEDVVLTPLGSDLDGRVTYTAGNFTILDADTATMAFTTGSDSIAEESSVPLPVIVQLVIGGNTLENAAQFQVIVASLGSTMASDFDAASFPKVVMFPPGSGDSTQTVTLAPTGDAISEGNESLTLGLAKVSGASTVTVTSTGNSTQTVTIIDDDIDLKVTNVDSVDPVVPGSGTGNLTYTVTTSNVGLTTATAITVTEVLVLPAGVTIVSITPSGTTTYTPPNAANGKWFIPSLAAGKSEKLTIVLTVGAGTAPGMDVISSAATVMGSSGNRINQADDAATQKTSVAANTLDFGDALNSYGTLLASNGARHHISKLFLGAAVDPELDGKPNATATGDKDDGVTMPSYLVPGLDASIKVVASAAGKLDAWIDFKRNGVFDAVDRVFASFAVAAGTNTLKFAVPTTAVAGTTFARFRLSSAGGLVPTGEAADGEVEDYAIKVMTAATDSAVLIDDPATPGKKVLVISGTAKNDIFQLQLMSGGVLLCKHGCKLNTYSLASIGRIVFLSGGGSDTVTLPMSLNIPMQFVGQWKVNKTK